MLTTKKDTLDFVWQLALVLRDMTNDGCTLDSEQCAVVMDAVARYLLNEDTSAMTYTGIMKWIEAQYE